MVACGIVLIGGMSVFLALRQDPESLYRVSDDGVVTMTGMTRETQALHITTGDALTGAVLTGSAYTIGEDGVVLDAAMQVTFKAADGQIAYHYRSDLAAWEPVADVTAADGLLTFSTTQLGMYAVGAAETVAAPEFIATYDSLRDAAPNDAVGYVIRVSYARPGEPSVLLLDIGEQGGCGGAVLPGESQATSQEARSASVLVNDVQTSVGFTFRAMWSLAPGGCPKLSPFAAAAERGILPSS